MVGSIKSCNTGVTDRSYDGIWPLAAFPGSTAPYWLLLAYTIQKNDLIQDNLLKKHLAKLHIHLTLFSAVTFAIFQIQTLNQCHK